MIRTQVYLTNRQRRALKKRARQEDLNFSEVLRRMIDAGLKAQKEAEEKARISRRWGFGF